MKSRTPVSKFSVLLGGMLSAVVLSASAFAQHGGGGHAGGGGHFGGGAGGHAIAGGHPGAYGGYRGGYGPGWHGGYGGYYGGWRGGYYGGWRGGGWGWGCCGWGWGWGLGLGLYFASLPLYYQTYYWDGVPYYYADNTYYVYDPNARQYQTVAPPDGLATQVQGSSAGGPPPGTELIAYPKNGQSADQQSKDKFECHEWAAGQTGYDPTTGGAAPANKRTDYMRAQAACLEGRGYSVQ
jgi:hypothetical protein